MPALTLDVLLRTILALALHGVALAQPPTAPASNARLMGHVIGPLGDPVPAAEVWAQGWDGTTLASTRADGDGFFVLDGLEPGGVIVRATAEGLHAGSDYGAARPANEDPRPCLLRLYEGQTVRGTVVDESGAPVAGATVLGWSSGRGFSALYEAATVTTDAEGRFAIAKLAAGPTAYSIWCDGFLPRHVSWPSAGSGPDAIFAIQRGEGIRLTVRAVDVPEDHAHPVHVSFHTRDGAVLPPRSRTRGLVDPVEGFESLPFAPDTKFVGIRVESAGLVFDPARGDAIEPPYEFVGRATPADASELEAREISVTVRALDGTPLAGVDVEVWCHARTLDLHTVTDAEGSFSLSAGWSVEDEVHVYLENTEYYLAPRDPDRPQAFADGRWEGTIGQLDGAALVALHGHDLRARVLAPDGRTPVRFARLRLSHPDHPNWPWATTDRDGVAVWRGLSAPPEEFEVIAETTRFCGRGRPAADGTLELVTREAATIGGTVTQQGEPLPHCGVWLRRWDLARGRQLDGSVTPTRADGRGRYRFVGVADGGYYLEVVANGEKVFRGEPFEVRDGTAVCADLAATR